MPPTPETDRVTLAALINAYHDIVRQAPARTPTWWGFLRYFFLARHEVAGHRWSLHRLERAIREFGDPRVHFALNCGAASCPAIRLYEADALDRQLDVAARTYLADPRAIRFDIPARTVHLSQLFRWYRRDFGDPLAFVEPYLTADQAAALAAIGPTPRLRFMPWDWTPTP